MNDTQYGYRFYDSRDYVGPLTRDQVLDKLRDDKATLPVERRAIGDDTWTPWSDSTELMWEIGAASECIGEAK